jgi:hypothetical protein
VPRRPATITQADVARAIRGAKQTGAVCDRRLDSWELTKTLFASWKDWAETAGEHAGTRKRFVQALKNRGFRCQRRHNGRGNRRTEYQAVTLVTLPPYIDVYAYTPIASASVTNVTLWGERRHRRLVALRLRRTTLVAKQTTDNHGSRGGPPLVPAGRAP